MTCQVGIIGCGQISSAYLGTLVRDGGGIVELAACADLKKEAARERAAEFGVPCVLSVEELLADPDIRIVANLAIPEAHFEINRSALLAGKHVYTEKPLALSREETAELGTLASKRNLFLSCAPDTLLGRGTQRTRKLIDEGIIGTPASAFAQIFMGGTRFRKYLRRGVGPLLDMGPYHIAALVYVLGPVVRVSALATHAVVESYQGDRFAPEEPPRAGVVLEFASGPLAFLSTQSFGPTYAPRLEFFGREGALACPDPNKFDGDWMLEGNPLPATATDVEPLYQSRGAGIIDMARALREGRDCHLNTPFSLHCAEVLLAAHASAASGMAEMIRTTCERPGEA